MPRKLQILAVMMRLGDGHLSPCKALARSAEALYPGQFEIDTIDLFPALGMHRFDAIVKRGWRLFAAKRPMFAALYSVSNSSRFQLLVRLAMTGAAKKLAHRLTTATPDYLFCTSPLSLAAIDRARRYCELPKLVVYNTDAFAVHARWKSFGDCIYLNPAPTIAAATSANDIRVRFLDHNAIYAPAAHGHSSWCTERTRVGLHRILIIDGGEGLGISASLVAGLSAFEGLHIDVITGRNEKVKKELLGLVELHKRDQVHIHGYVNDIRLFIESADLVVTKSGVNTILECLKARTPMLLTSYLANEYGAYQFVIANGLGCSGLGTSRCLSVIANLRSRPEIILEMRRRIDDVMYREGTRPDAISIMRNAYVESRRDPGKRHSEETLGQEATTTCAW